MVIEHALGSFLSQVDNIDLYVHCDLLSHRLYKLYWDLKTPEHSQIHLLNSIYLNVDRFQNMAVLLFLARRSKIVTTNLYIKYPDLTMK